MNKKTKTITAFAIVIVLTIFLHRIHILQPLEEFFIRAGAFVSSPFYSFKEYSSHAFTSKKELYKLVEEYEKEKEQYIIDTTRLALLEEENKELRSQQHFTQQHNYNSIGADVIGRTLDPLATIIHINKGFEDGVALENPVIIGDGILIGKIQNIFPHTSFVRLINDNNSSIGAMLMNSERSIGLIEGGYGLGVHMNLIPQNEIVIPGDTIVTSGLTENIPRGLLIGSVEIVEKQAHEPFQQAVVKPFADLSLLHSVSILQYNTAQTQ